MKAPTHIRRAYKDLLLCIPLSGQFPQWRAITKWSVKLDSERGELVVTASNVLVWGSVTRRFKYSDRQVTASRVMSLFKNLEKFD